MRTITIIHKCIPNRWNVHSVPLTSRAYKNDKSYLSPLNIYRHVDLCFNAKARQKSIAGFGNKVLLLFNEQRQSFYLFKERNQKEEEKGFSFLTWPMDTWCPKAMSINLRRDNLHIPTRGLFIQESLLFVCLWI